MVTLLKDRVINRRFMTKDRVMKGHFMKNHNNQWYKFTWTT